MNELSEGGVSNISQEMTAGANVYLNYLATKVPAFIKKPSVSSFVSTTDMKPDVPEWYIKASAINRQYLNELISERWRLQDSPDDTGRFAKGHQ